MHWIDPNHLPETSGVVDCFLLNGEGEADGLVLKDGTEVHFPPHMGSDILAAVRPGSTVQVRGVRPRGVAMVAAVSIAPEEGARIVDTGPPNDDGARKAARKRAHARRTNMEAHGVVRQLLHGPKGEVRGVLLEDGRSGRFPPHMLRISQESWCRMRRCCCAAKASRPRTARSSPSGRSARQRMISDLSRPKSRSRATKIISRTGLVRTTATPAKRIRSEAIPKWRPGARRRARLPA